MQCRTATATAAVYGDQAAFGLGAFAGYQQSRAVERATRRLPAASAHAADGVDSCGMQV